jgi:hypothetical protein
MPLLGKAPLQPSPAVHDVALVDAQVNVDVSPGATTDGFTLKFAVGITLTVVLALEVPPGPVQDSEYTAAPDKGPVLCAPLSATAPFQAPEAEHEAALLAAQFSVAALPAATAIGEAVKVTIGTGTMETVTLADEEMPPGPMQLSEYVAAELRGAVLCMPLALRVPLQAPDAAHDVAPVELQNRTVA